MADDPQTTGGGGAPEVELMVAGVRVRLDLDGLDEQLEQLTTMIEERVAEAVRVGLSGGLSDSQNLDLEPVSREEPGGARSVGLNEIDIDGLGDQVDSTPAGAETEAGSRENLIEIIREGVNALGFKIDDLAELVERSNEIQESGGDL